MDTAWAKLQKIKNTQNCEVTINIIDGYKNITNKIQNVRGVMFTHTGFQVLEKIIMQSGKLATKKKKTLGSLTSHNPRHSENTTEIY